MCNNNRITKNADVYDKVNRDDDLDGAEHVQNDGGLEHGNEVLRVRDFDWLFPVHSS